MKKTLTKEQEQQRQERKARIAAIVKRVADMSDEERAALASRIEIRNVEGHTLSQRNQLLIALQLGTHCTIVAGFAGWIKQGRCVIKGQKGAAIAVPCKSKKDENKQPGEISSAEDRPYFVGGTVFDISQTAELADANEENAPSQWQPGDEQSSQDSAELAQPLALETV